MLPVKEARPEPLRYHKDNLVQEREAHLELCKFLKEGDKVNISSHHRSISDIPKDIKYLENADVVSLGSHQVTKLTQKEGQTKKEAREESAREWRKGFEVVRQLRDISDKGPEEYNIHDLSHPNVSLKAKAKQKQHEFKVNRPFRDTEHLSSPSTSPSKDKETNGLVLRQTNQKTSFTSQKSPSGTLDAAQVSTPKEGAGTSIFQMIKNKASKSLLPQSGGPPSPVKMAGELSICPELNAEDSTRDIFTLPTRSEDPELHLKREMHKMQQSFMIWDDTPAEEVMGCWPVIEEEEAVCVNGMVLRSKNPADDGQEFTEQHRQVLLKLLDSRMCRSVHYRSRNDDVNEEAAAKTRFAFFPKHLRSIPAYNDDEKASDLISKASQKLPFGSKIGQPSGHFPPSTNTPRVHQAQLLSSPASLESDHPISTSTRALKSNGPVGELVDGTDQHARNPNMGLGIQFPPGSHGSDEAVNERQSDTPFEPCSYEWPQTPSTPNTFLASSATESFGSISQMERGHASSAQGTATTFKQVLGREPDDNNSGILSPLSTMSSSEIRRQLFAGPEGTKAGYPKERAEEAAQQQRYPDVSDAEAQQASQGVVKLNKPLSSKKGGVKKGIEKQMNALSHIEKKISKLKGEYEQCQGTLKSQSTELARAQTRLADERMLSDSLAVKEVQRLRSEVDRMYKRVVKLYGKLEKERGIYACKASELEEMKQRREELREMLERHESASSHVNREDQDRKCNHPLGSFTMPS